MRMRTNAHFDHVLGDLLTEPDTGAILLVNDNNKAIAGEFLELQVQKPR